MDDCYAANCPTAIGEAVFRNLIDNDTKYESGIDCGQASSIGSYFASVDQAIGSAW